MEAIRRLAMSAGLSGLLVLGFAAPSLAANQQGLVNVNVEGVTVQLPIAIAANVCDTNVNVLATQFRGTDAVCVSDAEAGAEFPLGNGNGNGNGTNQNGLINVNVEDVLIQVPIAVAANICDTNVNVLSLQARLFGDTECDAVANSTAG